MISGNVDAGIDYLTASSASSSIQGNLIGTDATGTKPLGTQRYPRRRRGDHRGQNAVAPDGTVTRTAGNVISGNDDGIVGGSGNTIEGNYIGTDITGTRPLGNDNGFHRGRRGQQHHDRRARRRGCATSSRPTAALGIYLLGSVNDVIQGNYIGTDVTGRPAR